VGQTIGSLSDRWCKHNNKGHALFSAIQKYGKESFIVEAIDTATTIEELNNKEIEWIKKIDSISPNGYNIRLGGNSGGKLSEETKKKMSTAKKGLLIGRKRSPEFCKNLSNKMKGIVFSDDHKSKLSLAKNHKKKPIICIDTGIIYESACDAARQLTGSHAHISKCVNGKRKTHLGLKFRYVDAK